MLVVEDEQDLRFLVTRLLDGAGFSVTEAADGRDALRAFYDTRPDVVLLDVGLPGLDGFSVLERIREVSDVPVLMLTAQAAELQKVRGFQSGADDYVTKPFGRQELVARVGALLRRTPRGPDAPEVHSDDVVELDFARHRASACGKALDLTPQEFRLLATLVRHPGQLLTHDQLLELAWGDPDGGARDRVKVYVGYLRRKLGAAGADPIETVRGMGYRYRGTA